MQHHTFYELDRLVVSALDAAGSGQQPLAPWLFRTGERRVPRRRRAYGLWPRPVATPVAEAGCR